VAAIKAAGSGGKRAGRPKKATAPETRKRATITDAVRAEVKALVKAGKTGSHCLWEASHKQCYDAQRIMLT